MRIKNNVVDWISLGLSVAAFFIAAVFLALHYQELPDKVATHFRINGEANGFSDKSMLIFFLGIIAVMIIIFQVSLRFPGMWNFPIQITDGNREIVYRLGKYMLEMMQVIISVSFSAMLVLMSLQKNIPSWLTYVLLGVLIGGGLIWTIVICVKGKANA